MWPHSSSAHSRPDSWLGRGRRVREGSRRCGSFCLPASTRGNHMVRARGLAVLTVATFVAFACGGTTGNSGSKGEIDIASDLPTSGADATSGLPTQEGANFAVTRAATVRGYTLRFVPFDDAVIGVHDPAHGVQNVQAMISNKLILGMV